MAKNRNAGGFNLNPDKYFMGLMSQSKVSEKTKQIMLNKKRKLSEIIIQDIEADENETPNTRKNAKELVSKLSNETKTSEDSFRIEEDCLSDLEAEKQPTRLKSFDHFRLSSPKLNKKAINRQSYFLIDEINQDDEIDSTQDSIVSTCFLDAKQLETEASMSSLFQLKNKNKSFQNTYNKLTKTTTSNDQDSLTIEKNLNEQQDRGCLRDQIGKEIVDKNTPDSKIRIVTVRPTNINNNDNNSTELSNSKKTNYDLDEILVGEESEKLCRRRRRCVTNLINQMDYLDEEDAELEQNEIFSLSAQSLSLDDDDVSPTSVDERANATITNSINHRKGASDWLRETLLVKTTALEETNLNETTIVSRKTSPPSIGVNTSNLFLTENDIKKRKVKYVKNGLAEKLQKILVRQASSVNFIKHHMNKNKKTDDRQTQALKSTDNLIRVLPFYRHRFLNDQFSLVQGLTVETQVQEYVMLLIDSKSIDSSFFERDQPPPQTVLTIYPPWRKMLLFNNKRLSVYFNLNLIEMESYKTNKTPIYSTSSLSISSSGCPECRVNSLHGQCHLDLFNANIWLSTIAMSNNSSNNNKHQLECNSSQIIFYNNKNPYLQTQTQVGQQGLGYDTQYMNFNSILDALENVGYFGLVTFRAAVQRVGLLRYAFNSYHHESSYLSTQSRKSSQLSSQKNCQFKHQIIVSDKCGMFGLVLFPFNVDFVNVFESGKYQFNCIRYLEKQSLCQKENEVLDDQINFLWKAMNDRRQQKSKPVIRAYQRNIFIFEFTGSTHSCLEYQSLSNNFCQLPSFVSFKAVEDFILKNSLSKTLFNLSSIALVKLLELPVDLLSQVENKKLVLFFADKNLKEIYSIGFETMLQLDRDLAAKLKENTVVKAKANYSLKNIVLYREEGENQEFKLDTNLFSSLSCTDDCLEDINDQFIMEHVFMRVEDDLAVNKYDFVQFTGEITSLCEENCSFDFHCSNCNAQERSSSTLACCSQLDFDEEGWFCAKCKHRDKTPVVSIQMQVILNCVGVYRQVRAKLHPRTIQKYVSIENLMCMYSTGHKNEEFDISSLLGRELGPLFCFIDSINDLEILAQELVLE